MDWSHSLLRVLLNFCEKMIERLCFREIMLLKDKALKDRVLKDHVCEGQYSWNTMLWKTVLWKEHSSKDNVCERLYFWKTMLWQTVLVKDYTFERLYCERLYSWNTMPWKAMLLLNERPCRRCKSPVEMSQRNAFVHEKKGYISAEPHITSFLCFFPMKRSVWHPCSLKHFWRHFMLNIISGLSSLLKDNDCIYQHHRAKPIGVALSTRASTLRMQCTDQWCRRDFTDLLQIRASLCTLHSCSYETIENVHNTLNVQRRNVALNDRKRAYIMKYPRSKCRFKRSKTCIAHETSWPAMLEELPKSVACQSILPMNPICADSTQSARVWCQHTLKASM